MDYMVIASGTSNRHVRSLADNVAVAAKQRGYRPIGMEGEGAADWVLVDFGDVERCFKIGSKRFKMLRLNIIR